MVSIPAWQSDAGVFHLCCSCEFKPSSSLHFTGCGCIMLHYQGKAGQGDVQR